LATAKFLTHFIISVLENVPLSRVTEKSNFSTLNVGLAGTGSTFSSTAIEIIDKLKICSSKIESVPAS
jgi:hypothetical protein